MVSLLYFPKRIIGLSGALLVYHYAVDEVDGAVGERGELFVVGDDDERLSQFVAQPEQPVVQLGLVLRVAAAGGLVGADDVGFVPPCARHGPALPFAARELCGAVLGAFAKAEIVEQLHGAFLHAAAAEPSGNHGGDHHVFEGGELRHELVELEHEAEVLAAEACQSRTAQREHVVAGDAERAAVGARQGAGYLQQGGLARAAGSYDAHHLTLGDVQVDAFQHLELPEGFS